MRLLPRSLFGRLVLVLITGLTLAQLVTAYINRTERNQLLYRAGGMRLAQQMSDIVKLLDSLSGEERRRVVAVFKRPPLAISIDRPRLAPSTAPAEDDVALTMFTSALRYALGDGTEANVIRPEGLPEGFRLPARIGQQDTNRIPGQMRGHGMQYGHRMQELAASGAFFTVQTALRDGTLVTFDTFLSPQVTGFPLRLALTLLVLLGTVILLSLVAVRWVTGPLSTLATAAEELGEDINRPPLAETGPAEVQRAAKAFNTMQQRLSRFISERTRILAAMSHDLKTPITRLRLRAELLDDEVLRSKFEKDLQEMESMVTQTLDFMRDANAVEPLQRVDVMALLESVQTDYQEGGSAVHIDGTASRPFLGRPLALRRCLTNLLDNALRYGKRAKLVVEDNLDALVIRILDEGPGMPEQELEQAFEPFFRGEASRNRETGGTGLGLGIARNIARAHGGDVVLKNRPDGGLEAVLSLPRRMDSTAAS